MPRCPYDWLFNDKEMFSKAENLKTAKLMLAKSFVFPPLRPPFKTYFDKNFSLNKISERCYSLSAIYLI